MENFGKFMDLGLGIVKVESEEKDGLGFESLGIRVLGGFKVGVFCAICGG